jgi:hypothetical protein
LLSQTVPALSYPVSTAMNQFRTRGHRERKKVGPYRFYSSDFWEKVKTFNIEKCGRI